MPETPIKFRCYRCNQLLGISPRKAGSVVNCPQCRSELRVPILDGGLDPDVPADLAELRPEDIRVEPEFANLVIDPAIVRPAPDSSGSVQVVEERVEVSAPVEAFLPRDAAEVAMPSIRVEPQPIAARAPAAHVVREVVLSPTVVLAWSLLVLLAVPLAFLAGLLTGHFIWR